MPHPPRSWLRDPPERSAADPLELLLPSQIWITAGAARLHFGAMPGVQAARDWSSARWRVPQVPRCLARTKRVWRPGRKLQWLKTVCLEQASSGLWPAGP